MKNASAVLTYYLSNANQSTLPKSRRGATKSDTSIRYLGWKKKKSRTITLRLLKFANAIMPYINRKTQDF